MASRAILRNIWQEHSAMVCHSRSSLGSRQIVSYQEASSRKRPIAKAPSTIKQLIVEISISAKKPSAKGPCRTDREPKATLLSPLNAPSTKDEGYCS